MSFHPDTKAQPSAVNRLVHGDPAVAAHRDLNQASTSAGPSGSPTFRQRDQASSNGSDEDFGRFLHARTSSARDLSLGSIGASFSADGEAQDIRSTSSPFGNAPVFPTHQDGSAIQSLLSSTNLTDSVHGDYTSELSATQSSPWRLAQDSSLPLDPAATLRGKGKAPAHPTSTPGDVSPISAELISSLSSLNLHDQTYLRTLLAQSPERAVADYFARGTYADDVWGVVDAPAGVPKAVDEIMSKAREGAEGSSAREKAVRRLAMVAQHLSDGAKQREGAGMRGVAGAVVEGAEQQERTSTSGGMHWADEYPLVAQHSSTHTASHPLADATAERQHTVPFAAFQTRQGLTALNQQAEYAQRAAMTSATQQLQPVATSHLAQQASSTAAQQASSSTRLREGFRPPPPGAQERSVKREADREDEQVGRSSLPPFRHYFEQKLRDMATSQQQWMARRI